MNAAGQRGWRTRTGWLLAVFLFGLAALQGGGVLRQHRPARLFVGAASAPMAVRAAAPASTFPGLTPAEVSPWKAAASTNLECLAAALQQAGWPADVAASVLGPMLMHQLEEELDRLPRQPFWLDHDASLAADLEHYNRRREVLLRFEAKSHQLLGRPLLGPECDDSFTDHSTIQALFRVLSGPLAEDTFARVLQDAFDLGMWMQEVEHLPQPWRKPAALECLEFGVARADQYLSSQEVGTMISRVLAMKLYDRYEDLEIQAGELQRMSATVANALTPAEVLAGLDDSDSEERKALYDEAALQTLGPDRFAAWLVDQDPEFKTLSDILERRADRTAVLLELRDLRSRTRQSLELTRTDFSRSLLERTLATQRLKLEATSEIEALLGSEGRKALEAKDQHDWFYPGGPP